MQCPSCKSRVRTVCPEPTGGGVTRAAEKGRSTLGLSLVCEGQPSPNARGPRAAFERPGRRPPVAAIHSRRKTQRASCKPCIRTACPVQTGGCGTREKGEGKRALALPGHKKRPRGRPCDEREVKGYGLTALVATNEGQNRSSRRSPPKVSSKKPVMMNPAAI